MRIFLPLIVTFFAFSSVFAQQLDLVALAKAHVLEKSGEWNLSSDDLQELVVSDHYVTKHSGTQHIYLTQQYRGIPIYNAIQSVAITKEGKAITVGKTRFIRGLSEKVNTTKADISASDAIGKLVDNLEQKSLRSQPQVLSKNESAVIFSGEGIAKQDIHVKLVYEQMPNGELLLAYQVQFDQLKSSDWWNARIDATSGEILAKDNFTIYCQFENNTFHNHDRKCNPKLQLKSTTSEVSNNQTNSYKVVPFPFESPIHAPFEIVSNPADATASPYGWHDDNGMDGPEYTITRGNNAHAYQDQQDTDVSSNDEPDGGAGLDFIFDVNFDDDPTLYQKAATTNLFYWMNIMHDFAYHYGFDEASGNFQQKNYTGEGAGNDYIRANAQDGYLTGNLNNANYSGGSDGTASRVQMYVFDGNSGGGTKYVTVTEPSTVAGGYPSVEASYGPPVPANPIVAAVVEVNDGLYNPYITDACETIINDTDLFGKIALVDRGGCFFQEKTLFAEAAGAVAVIVCNFEDDPMGMAGVGTLPAPTIPTVSMGGIDCATIRGFATSGELTISLGLPSDTGPEFLDGDFDNGIIAHEYAHGISNRLTGGPNAGGCLNNAEQMGEGWSDFFSLITSVSADDAGTDKRGVGTFVNRQDTEGRGIRRYPYSTDMTINPLVYGDVAANTEVHALGEVWTAVVWDLYWALVEAYGFDEDLYNGTKGNNLAVQLVMDGMKLQSCQPGFIDGRNGILAADEILTGGANQCLIWKVFARRGMGYYADQGSSLSASDQTEDFEPLPTCIEELKIAKNVTPIVNAGETIAVNVTVTNHKPETLAGITVSEVIPTGLSYVSGSSTISASQTGNELTFTIGEMQYLDVIEFTYEMATDPDIFSKQLFFEGAENDGLGWSPLPVEGLNLWSITNESNAGNWAYKVESENLETQQIILVEEEVTVEGENPVIRFFHNHDTESGQDGGVFQVTDDFGVGIWSNFDEEMFRGGYPGAIDYGTFVIPDFSAFWGNSNGYKPTYVDMNDYKGKKLFLRFNFATSDADAAGAPANGFWAVDDLELMDMVNYNPETCVTFDGGTQKCTSASGRGTIIESQIISSTKYLQNSGIEFGIYPNPAQDQLSISVSSLSVGKATLSLMTMDGKLMESRNIETTPQRQIIQLDVANAPSGFYIVRIANEDGAVNKKVVIQ